MFNKLTYIESFIKKFTPFFLFLGKKKGKFGRDKCKRGTILRQNDWDQSVQQNSRLSFQSFNKGQKIRVQRTEQKARVKCLSKET